MNVSPLELASRFGSAPTAPDAPDALAASADLTAADHRRGEPPRILLATTGALPSTARLALELHDAGARVSLISPRHHPGRVLDIFDSRMIYRAIAPCRSLEAALMRTGPDLVIPCDERAVRDLHQLYRGTSHRGLRLLIQRSIGCAETFPVVTSRAELLDLARRLGVRVPPSAPLPSVGALDEWMAGNAAPFVLKADGSWSGFGVRIIADPAAAKAEFADMTRRASGRLALREMVLEGNNFAARSWLKGERPTMSAQGYVNGWPANIGVACWQGEVLAATCVESVSTLSATGPSTVARIIDNREMTDSARRIVKALGLSGLIGFDFMIEAATGAAYLIEMNPRCTPICAVRLGPGRDLAEALVARLSHRPPRERPARTERDILVFFPDTWQVDPGNPYLHAGYHDVPWDQPKLVRILMRPEMRDRYAVTRMLRRAWWRLQGRKPPAN
nr:ATP-grasp domain-containing protein [uncultured Rhodopila sp.]